MRQRNDERRQRPRQSTGGQEAAERPRSAEANAASASASTSTDPLETEAEIRRRAYERYVSRGDGPGSDVEDWYAAEREVRDARPATDSPAAMEQGGVPVETRQSGPP